MKKILIGFFVFLLVTTIIFLIVWSFVFELFYVPSSSMKPTLLPGDYIGVHKSIDVNTLDYGDVIVFYHALKDQKEPHVKRILAKAGDKIEYKNEQLFLNNKQIQTIAVEAKMKNHQKPCDVILKQDPPERAQWALPPLSY